MTTTDKHASREAVPARFFARIAGHIRVPLVRNAYSLVASTLANSGLGVLFWIAAARLFSTSTVGTDASLISAMTFLSVLAQLNLANGFNRFVPTAGKATKRFVSRGYAITLFLAFILSLGFVVGVEHWASHLSFLADEPLSASWFILATMIWTIFVLEDSVLTGLREAHWVLVENVIYGVLKLGVLVAIASHASHLTVFVAWTAPLLLLVIPVNAYLYGRAFPNRAEQAPLEHPDPRTVARFLAPDFAASLVGTATTSLMPVIVLAIAGADASAYVYLAGTVAYTLYLVNLNVGMSLITEGARDPQHLVEYTRRALRHGAQIVVPLALVLVAAAPLALRFFGKQYASNGTLLLQLLALSAIPNLIVAIYVSAARARRRMRVVFVTVAGTSTAVLVLSIALLEIIGINGVGFGWLIAETLAAAIILLRGFRSL